MGCVAIAKSHMNLLLRGWWCYFDYDSALAGVSSVVMVDIYLRCC